MSASSASRRQRSFFFFLLSVLTGPEAPACGSRRTDLEDRLLALNDYRAHGHRIHLPKAPDSRPH